MIKFLFFDNRDYELVQGFERVLERPRKHSANPLLEADKPWEHAIVLGGSVVKVEDRPFQFWYTLAGPEPSTLAYAESEDGIVWHKPELDLGLHQGGQTNIVFDDTANGACVIYDDADPRKAWKYKMVCGAEPTGFVYAYRSPDGIHWSRAREEPIIGNDPDAPMSLHRRPDGTYAAHLRVAKVPDRTFIRRIGRSESTDFVNWSSVRVVLEPGPGDPAQFQMYGMGATMYGDYEIGTVWAYHTDLEDTSPNKMGGNQEAELTYSRRGTAWHRAMQGQAFIPHGDESDWDSGNVQCASAPVFLDNEIRYYFASSNVRHDSYWEKKPGRFGIGMASLKPDRFIALVAGDEPAEMYTRRFSLKSPEVYVNADIATDGAVRLELLDEESRPLPGFELSRCVPLTGDSLSHSVHWEGEPNLSEILNRPIRWRLQATHARVYAVWMPDGEAEISYHRFRSI
jgi:hypothetical protein